MHVRDSSVNPFVESEYFVNLIIFYNKRLKRIARPKGTPKKNTILIRNPENY